MKPLMNPNLTQSRGKAKINLTTLMDKLTRTNLFKHNESQIEAVRECKIILSIDCPSLYTTHIKMEIKQHKISVWILEIRDLFVDIFKNNNNVMQMKSELRTYIFLIPHLMQQIVIATTNSKQHTINN